VKVERGRRKFFRERKEMCGGELVVVQDYFIIRKFLYYLSFIHYILLVLETKFDLLGQK
jgi:hypothetical protein